MTKHHILFELPSVEGWALIAGATFTDPMSDLDPVDGYIKQEARIRAAQFRAAM